MTARSLGAGLVAIWILLSGIVCTALAAQPADSLLPATTKGYICAPNLDQLVEHFRRSQIGQLVNDPVMQPFVESIKTQLRQTGLRQLEQLGISWEDVQGLPGGEIALATVQPAPGEAAIVLVANVTGHRQQAEALAAKMSERISRNGGQRLRRAAGDPIVAFQLPNDAGRKIAPVAAYFIQNDMLVAGDNLPVLQAMSASMPGGRSDSLASVRAYREIMSRCAAASGEQVPQLQWFVEPFGYAETLTVDLPPRDKHKGPDLIKVLKGQGFDAIQGVGGFVDFSQEKYELVHRTMIYAPPIAGRNPLAIDRYNLAARMLRFPLAGDLMPQPWVPSDVASYTSLNFDIQTAFTSAESLVDEVIGEKGVYRDVLESLRDDPDGPRVDIEKSIVAHLGNRITMITDNELPIGPKSERKVFAVNVTDEQPVAEAIAKLMQADKDAKKRDFDGYVIWEIVERTCEAPKLEIETPGEMTHTETETSPKHDDHFLPTSTVCVAQGHLFLASHIELLEKVLGQQKQHDSLAGATDFDAISKEAGALQPSPVLRAFSRTDLAFRPTYELIRTGQMPQSETLLGKFLNGVMGDGKDGVPRKQRIDGHALPEFEVVRHYFGPAGTVMSNLDDGWLLSGFSVANRQVVADNHPATELSSAKP